MNMPACSDCGGDVTRDFVRVFGIDGEVHGCPDCSTYRELHDGDGVEGAPADEHRSPSFSTEERREKRTGDDQTDAGDEESDKSADETDTISIEYLERLLKVGAESVNIRSTNDQRANERSQWLLSINSGESAVSDLLSRLEFLRVHELDVLSVAFPLEVLFAERFLSHFAVDFVDVLEVEVDRLSQR